MPRLTFREQGCHDWRVVIRDGIRSRVRAYIAKGREVGTSVTLTRKAKGEIAARRRIGDAKLAEAMNSVREGARGALPGQSDAKTYAGTRTGK